MNWINAKDRLPTFEDDKVCSNMTELLVSVKRGKAYSYTDVATYDSEQKLWRINDRLILNALIINDDVEYCVTHWMKMPLPERD